MLLYTDDFLVISYCTEIIMRKEIGNYFELKEDSNGPNSIYLLDHMCEVDPKTRLESWAFGSTQYVKLDLNNVEEHLQKKVEILP